MNSNGEPDDPTLDLQHLQSELARLDVANEPVDARQGLCGTHARGDTKVLLDPRGLRFGADRRHQSDAARPGKPGRR